MSEEAPVVEAPPEPSLSPNSGEVSTAPGVIQYDKGNQVVVTNNPEFHQEFHNYNNGPAGPPSYEIAPRIGGDIEPPPPPMAELPPPVPEVPEAPQAAAGEQNSEIAGLKEEISGLRKDLSTLITQMQKLVEQNAELIQRLSAANVPAEPAEPEPATEPIEEHFGNLDGGDEPNEEDTKKIEKPEKPEEADEEYEYHFAPPLKEGDLVWAKDTSDEWEAWTVDKLYDKDGEQWVVIRQGSATGPNKIKHISETELAQMMNEYITSGAETPTTQTPEDKKESAWQKIKNMGPRGWFARFQSRGAEEEEPVEESEEKKRRSVLGYLLAGIAIGAAGIEFIEHVLEAKHGIPNSGIGRTIREHHSGGGNHNLIPDDSWRDQSGGGSGHEHLEAYNLANGNGGVKVELPKELHWNGLPGSNIFDDHGREIVHHVGFDRQGNFDQATKEALKSHDYVMHQDVLTYQGKAGPGEHFYTDVEASTK